MWAWASYVPIISGLFRGGEEMTEQEQTSGSEVKKDRRNATLPLVR